MPVKVQAPIEPYNDSYDVVNAKHVGVGEGENKKKLSDILNNLPSGGDITVDSELSLESENPVQNKVVTQEFKAFNEAIGDTNRRVSALESADGGGSEYAIPTFNLVEMGLPAIVLGGDLAAIETDTTEIIAALREGAVKFIAAVDMYGEVINLEAVMNGVIGSDGSAICSYLNSVIGASVTLVFEPGMIGGAFIPLSNGEGGNGGVSSWNDLTDKPFGENADGTVKQLDNKYLEPFELKGGETELLPSTTGTSQFFADYGLYGLPVESNYKMLLNWHGDGDSPITGNIFVEFDGVTYECAQQRIAAFDNGMAIGNCLTLGGAGNSEPFLISIIGTVMGGNTKAFFMVGTLNDAEPTEHTVRIYQKSAGKWLLKEEYLPDGLGGAVATPVSIDLSGFDTNGTIVETYADGTSKTTTMEFDASGNPIKITDADGNVTTLTW